jgi:hypothetical protein
VHIWRRRHQRHGTQFACCATWFGVKAGNVFDAAGRSIPSDMELWPGMLALALALNLLELVMRKWKGLLEALHLAPVEAS